MFKVTVLIAIAASSAIVAVAGAADSMPVAKPTIATLCTGCHKAEPGVLRGTFENVAFKAKTIQVKIDNVTELVNFDEDDIKVVNGEGKTGDGDFLKLNKMQGRQIKIEFVEANGIKTAIKLVEKPPVKVAEALLINTADIKRLVTQQAKHKNYYLFDTRPSAAFNEGYIPTAVNLPFSEFATRAGMLLPQDKHAPIVFYCSGKTCSTGPASAEKAQKLGYTNLKVYKDGMPGWLENNYGAVSVQSLQDTWLDKDIPHVLLDVRSEKDAAKGFIKGSVAFPAKQAAKLIKKLDIEQIAPIIVYDQKGNKAAASVATTLVKAGFTNVLVLDGGFDAWKSAKNNVASGKRAAKATYTAKARPGAIDLAEFEKYVAKLPDNVMIIDVRNPDETKLGKLGVAKAIPFEMLRNRLAEIPKDKLIITQCTTGVRAEMAYHVLKELGYTNVKFVNAKLEFEKNGTYKISKN